MSQMYETISEVQMSKSLTEVF